MLLKNWFTTGATPIRISWIISKAMTAPMIIFQLRCSTASTSSKEYTAIVGLPSDNFPEQYFDDISNVYLDLELLLGDGKTIFEVRGNMILALLQDKRPQAISKITRRIAQIIERNTV